MVSDPQIQPPLSIEITPGGYPAYRNPMFDALIIASVLAPSTILRLSVRTELRNKKRRDVVSTIVIRQEPVHLVDRLYQIPERTILELLPLYRAGGWDALKEGRRSEAHRG